MISSVLLIQFGLYCYVRSCRKYRWMYPQPPDHLMAWHGNNHIILNTNKTKGMIVDIWRTTDPRMFNWTTDKTMSMLCKRRDGEGSISLNQMEDKVIHSWQQGDAYLLYSKSVVKIVLCLTAICWGSDIRASDSNKLKKLINKAGSVLGSPLKSLDLIV